MAKSPDFFEGSSVENSAGLVTVTHIRHARDDGQPAQSLLHLGPVAARHHSHARIKAVLGCAFFLKLPLSHVAFDINVFQRKMVGR